MKLIDRLSFDFLKGCIAGIVVTALDRHRKERH